MVSNKGLIVPFGAYLVGMLGGLFVALEGLPPGGSTTLTYWRPMLVGVIGWLVVLLIRAFAVQVIDRVDEHQRQASDER